MRHICLKTRDSDFHWGRAGRQTGSPEVVQEVVADLEKVAFQPLQSHGRLDSEWGQCSTWCPCPGGRSPLCSQCTEHRRCFHHIYRYIAWFSFPMFRGEKEIDLQPLSKNHLLTQFFSEPSSKEWHPPPPFK